MDRRSRHPPAQSLVGASREKEAGLPSDLTAIPLAQSPLGLWVPAHLISARRRLQRAEHILPPPRMLRFAVTTAGWKDVTGKTARIEEVIDRIRRYSVRQVGFMVARISMALQLMQRDEDGAPQRHGQHLIAERLVGKEIADAMVERARASRKDDVDGDRFAFFHERQTLNALKIAFIVTDVDAPDNDIDALPLVEALLMLNDLLDSEFEGLDLETDDGRSKMELYVAANTLFNESSHLLHDFVRAHYLYIEAHPELIGRNVIDVPSAIARAEGIDAETVWRALFAIYSDLRTWTLADLDEGRIACNMSSFLSTLPDLSPSEQERWFGLATWRAGELQERFRREYSVDDPRFFDVLPFEERPLVAFGTDVICASIPLFDRLPGGALQHRLLNEKIFGKKERRRFLDTRGHLVERYTLDALTRAFGQRFLSEAQLQAHAPGKSVCDGIVLYPDAVILIECKTSSPLLDTRHAKDYARYRAKWRESVNKAADQFVSTIDLIRGGAFIPLGIDPAIVKEFFPVVAVFEQALSPLAYRAIRSLDLAEHALAGRMDAGEVAQVQFLNINEVELWEMAAESGRSVLELLREKTSDQESTEMSFHHFIHLRGETFQHGHGAWHAARFTQIGDEALAFYRKLGLPSEASAAG